MNDLHERLFALLDERYRRILSKHCANTPGWQGRAFQNSIYEWNELLEQYGIEYTDALSEWRLRNGVANHIRWALQREPEINFVSDPCYELGIRIGLLTGNHRLLKMDGDLAMRILALGLP